MASISTRTKKDGSKSFMVRWREPKTGKAQGLTVASESEAETLKRLLDANAEAENCVKTVKAGNLATATARLTKAKEQIERQGTMINLRVDETYHHLRIQEMVLAAEHLQALAAEKELERARREDLREQKKAEA